MAQEWRVLLKIVWHATLNGLAILTFIGLSALTKWGIKDGWLLAIVDDIEGVVLIVLVLIFAVQVIYDVLPEKIREKVVLVFTRKFVFA